jgi:hypothetical protein
MLKAHGAPEIFICQFVKSFFFLYFYRNQKVIYLLLFDLEN